MRSALRAQSWTGWSLPMSILTISRVWAVLARKHHVPIYGTKETLEEVAANTKLGEYPKELLHPVLPDADFQIGDLTLEPFSIHHDAANPVAYRVSHESKSVAVATDMGHFDQYTLTTFRGWTHFCWKRTMT